MQLARLGVDGQGDGESCEASISTLEHASVVVSAGGSPLDLGDIALGVNGLWTASHKRALKLITN